MFLKCLFCWWKPGIKGNLKDAQIILTQASSDMEDGSSSKSNKILAETAKFYSEKLNIPIFAQGEVAKVLKEMNVNSLVGSTPCEAIPDNFESKDYYGTSGVALIQKKYCDEHNIKNALILALYPHTWRAMWTYEKIGIKIILPPKSPSMIFEKKANQHRWRKAITAYPYELSARLKYLFMGLI